uniref:Uncharacterized protein n=1 Tax=Anguilla anguilla TaxID=7936 RepID=A0A0E9PZY9_ANGAN
MSQSICLSIYLSLSLSHSRGAAVMGDASDLDTG